MKLTRREQSNKSQAETDVLETLKNKQAVVCQYSAGATD